jgi:hypothetical protein
MGVNYSELSHDKKSEIFQDKSKNDILSACCISIEDEILRTSYRGKNVYQKSDQNGMKSVGIRMPNLYYWLFFLPQMIINNTNIFQLMLCLIVMLAIDNLAFLLINSTSVTKDSDILNGYILLVLTLFGIFVWFNDRVKEFAKIDRNHQIYKFNFIIYETNIFNLMSHLRGFKRNFSQWCLSISVLLRVYIFFIPIFIYAIFCCQIGWYAYKQESLNFDYSYFGRGLLAGFAINFGNEILFFVGCLIISKNEIFKIHNNYRKLEAILDNLSDQCWIELDDDELDILKNQRSKSFILSTSSHDNVLVEVRNEYLKNNGIE